MATYVRYVLDTNARFHQAQYEFEFGGQGFCLVRGTDSTFHELYTIIRGMPQDRVSVDELVQRLCDVWGWEWKNGVHLAGGEGVGVSEDTVLEDLPLLFPPSRGPRGSVSHPRTAPDVNSQNDTQAWALSLWNEARCSRSPFLSMINYWKILELPPRGGSVKGAAEKRAMDWVDSVCQSSIAVPDGFPARPGKYLYKECRNAIVHVTRKPFLQTHKMGDRRKTDEAARFAGRLAEHYTFNCLKVDEGLTYLKIRSRQRTRSRLVKQSRF